MIQEEKVTALIQTEDEHWEAVQRIMLNNFQQEYRLPGHPIAPLSEEGLGR